MDEGANLDAVSTDGQTALMINATHCRTSMVAFLLAKGADITIRSKASKTALSLAEESEDSTSQVIAVLRNWESPSS